MEVAVTEACCEGCQRPAKLCLCDVLPPEPVQTRTRVVILVHPKELRRKLGTLPLLRLCLQDIVIKEGDRFPEPEEDPELHQLITKEHQPMFLCPGPDAKELTTDEAKSMVSRSPWLLQHVPRAVIRPSAYSGYRFRKQPEQGCLSTLEAVAEALLALEGTKGPMLKEMLLSPFERMVELQCAFIGDEDKNIPSQQTTTKFDIEAALMDLHRRGEVKASDQSAELFCILRWGERAVPERPTIVVELFHGSNEEAKQRAQVGSVGGVSDVQPPLPKAKGNSGGNNTTQGASKPKSNGRHEKSAAGTGGGKYLCRVKVGIEEDVSFQVCRRIIGPGGENMKRIIETVGHGAVKIRLRGRGSKYLEGPEHKESNDDLMLCVSATNRRSFEKASGLVEALIGTVQKDYVAFCQARCLPVPTLNVKREAQRSR
eukprot:symbB.v1.2.004557.t2/scaffold245.1/size253980/14